MLNRGMAAAAAMMMAASPCAAAQLQEHQELGAYQRGAWVGAYFRLPFATGRERRPRAQVGLRVAAVHSYRDARTPTGPMYQTDALDLRLTGLSRPTLLVAGRPVQDRSEPRLNLSTGETIAIAGGGLLLLVLVAAAAGGGGFPDTCPTVDGSRDHCI